MQEGGESHDSFMASLTSQNDSRSLMPADSAFRMVSSVPAQSSEGMSPSLVARLIFPLASEKQPFEYVGQSAAITVLGLTHDPTTCIGVFSGADILCSCKGNPGGWFAAAQEKP